MKRQGMYSRKYGGRRKHATNSKHELSLAEFPLGMLAKQGYEKTRPYVYEDEITVEGKKVRRIWKIKPDAELGHATPSTYATLYDLLQIWQDTGFKDQYIHFGSIQELCKRRNVKNPGKKMYQQLKDDIDRLVAITYDVENAFWDNTKRMYVSKTFHIFEHATYYGNGSNNGAAWGEGYVKVSDVLYESVLANSLLYLEFDSDFFHSLTPLQQRLAVYLSKALKFQKVHKRDIVEFAKQLPILITEKKKIKYKLRKASEDLIEKGFTLLKAVTFQKSLKAQKEHIIFTRNEKTIALEEMSEPSEAELQATEVVTYFHKTLQRSHHQPTPQELSQATQLLTNYGVEQTIYIVDYALKAAQKTNFDMQYFGAIFQYQSEAVNAYNEQHARIGLARIGHDGTGPQQLKLVLPAEEEKQQETKLQQQFDRLDAETKAQLTARAEQKLAAYKDRMTPEAYAETLHIAIGQELYDFFQNASSQKHEG